MVIMEWAAFEVVGFAASMIGECHHVFEGC
jgi:hypothetical protein